MDKTEKVMAELEAKSKAFTQATKDESSEQILAEMRGEYTFDEQVESARQYRQEIVDEYLRGVWHDSNEEQPKVGTTVVIWDGYYGEVLPHIVSVHPDRKWAYLYELFKED